MTKKRIVAMVVSSPIILPALACMVLISLVVYATTGRWELKRLIHEWVK